MNKENFADFDLSEALLKAIDEKGYSTPSAIQQQSIPAVLNGQDVIAAAQTGTGKTASFTLPLLQRLSEGKQAGANQVRVLVLVPTRELAIQVAENVASYSRYLQLRSFAVFGGVKINPQMLKLTKGVDVLVATPGRLLDLYNQNAIQFKLLETLVLDEADRMLDMGFIADIRRIFALLPAQRQNLLFSATLSPDIKTLAKGFLYHPREITIAPKETTAKLVEQWVYPVDKKQKPELLAHLIHNREWHQVLVFVATKKSANKLSHYLDGLGIKAAAIHGNKSQSARTRVLKEFKAGDYDVLVATDMAARGLDIEQLPHVVNFQLPHVSQDYVHRIGRTGRAGVSGQAISFVSADEFGELSNIERLIQQLIPRQEIAGYEPTQTLPVSVMRPPYKPKKPKKPKKAKPR